ncbi:MAG: hypothetical protein M5R40_15355 [Anaerolineae bacterium]|nr:hypothetical protein [Anaerolineae bacterium]
MLITFYVKPETLNDLPALERRHNAKFVSAIVKGDEVMVTLMEVATLNWFVEVHEGRGVLMLSGSEGSIPAADMFHLDRERLSRLIKRVIYDDNRATSPLGEAFYPQTPESLALFEALMTTARPARV